MDVSILVTKGIATTGARTLLVAPGLRNKKLLGTTRTNMSLDVYHWNSQKAHSTAPRRAPQRPAPRLRSWRSSDSPVKGGLTAIKGGTQLPDPTRPNTTCQAERCHCLEDALSSKGSAICCDALSFFVAMWKIATLLTWNDVQLLHSEVLAAQDVVLCCAFQDWVYVELEL